MIKTLSVVKEKLPPNKPLLLPGALIHDPYQRPQSSGPLETVLGVSKFESSRIVESVLETIKTSLSNGEDVLISGFGKFSAKKKAPRKGKKPCNRRGPAS